MIKTFTLFTAVLLLTFVNGQTLAPTYSISTSGTANTFKGGYTFAYTTAGVPWSGSLISFGGFSNNYDTQISTDYIFGNSISYRTRNGDNNVWNSWKEIWHSGNLNNVNSDFSARNLVVNGSTKFNSNSDYTYLSLGKKLNDQIIVDNHSLKHYGGGYFFRVHNENVADKYIDVLMLSEEGNVRIGLKLGVGGKSSFNDDMQVNGKIEAKEIKVTTTPTADFVFADDYELPTLEEVEKHIKEKKHLPEIASAKKMEKEGVNVGEFQIKLLQKIEELTLYSIQQNKHIHSLQELLKEQETKIDQLEKTINTKDK